MRCRHLHGWGLLAISLVVLCWWRFGSWLPEVWFGDDLANLRAFQEQKFASSPAQALLGSYADKYRPVFAAVLGTLFAVFGQDLALYLLANIALHGACGVLAFVFARRLSGSRLVGLSCAAVAVSSRFALYQVTQVTGLLEGLGTLAFIGLLLNVQRFTQDQSLYRVTHLCIIEWVLIHTHERYLVIAPWLVLLFATTRGPARTKILWICMAITPALFNVALKLVAFGSSTLLAGTGGTQIRPSVWDVNTHLSDALFSLFGFNTGPMYLVGFQTSLDATPKAFALGLLFFFAWVSVLTLACWGLVTRMRSVQKAPALVSMPLLWLVLAVLLLVPPSLTIRLEQRWLVQPQLLVMTVAAWGAGMVMKVPRPGAWRRIAQVLVVMMSLAAVGIDMVAENRFNRIFFVESGLFAGSVKREVVDKGLVSTRRPLVVFANTSYCDWVLGRGDFFLLYSGVKLPVVCTDLGDRAQAVEKIKVVSSSNRTTPMYLASSFGEGVWDVTRDIEATCDELPRQNLLGLFHTGKINDERHVDTPTGTGAFIFNVPSQLGLTSTLTLVTGFSFEYPHLELRAGTVLRFEIGMGLPANDASHARVALKYADGRMEILYSEDVPATYRKSARLIPVSIALERFGGRASLVFSVETPPGRDESGHWVAFGQPRFVSLKQCDH